ncbi:hypothetical protein VTL71DRAFT_15538 [Oculimacula yallundae]|uniref:Uncharacterized protein n=1 Tax=Oculimacula yallundae TaxID=86028 RepID=A0ABR4CGW8_9HELO
MFRISIPNFLKATLLSGTIFSLALLYGWTHFYRDPGSIFFDQSRAFESKYSLHREREAIAYWNNITASLQDIENERASGEFFKAGADPTICVTFLTIARKTDKQYIDLALSSTLAGLSPVERADIDLKIYFADTDPIVHPSWQTVLANVSDETYSPYGTVSPSQFAKLVTLEREGNFGAKGSIDYATALNHCYATSTAPYIAIFEDDILVADSWLTRSLLALRDINAQMARKSVRKEPGWLFMRLFNEERASGWASHALFANNTPLISLGIGLALATILIYLRDYWKGGSKMLARRLDNAVIFVVCGLSVPAFVILFYQAGKASMLPPSPGVRMQDFGCCTQGMVFPRESVPGVVEHLHKAAEVHRPYDVAMDDYATENGLERFALYPVMVQHVGERSVITPDRRGDSRVWSMAFESLNPERLRAYHSRILKQIYAL